jgi:DNA-directed RNA polymerase subunit RPC12/RpoP
MNYKCDICDKVCRASCNMVRHNEVHRFKLNGIDYICEICQLKYKSIRLLTLHLQIVHGNEQSICNKCHNDHIDRNQLDKQEYICSKCGQIFDGNGKLANTITVNNTVQCDICDQLVNKYDYFIHAQSHLKQ